MVRAPALRAGGHRFDACHLILLILAGHASVAQRIERGRSNPEVVGSSPTIGTLK